MADRHKRRLRNYLLDSKLQLRYTLIMVVISSLLTVGLGYIWYAQMRETSKTVEVKALATLSDAEIEQLQEDMATGDNLRLLALVGFGLIFALVVLGYGIMLTHKVAGPLFKISRYMGEITEGRLGPIYDLRRGDQLHEFYGTFKEMHGTLRQRAEEDVRILSEVIDASERHLALSEGNGKDEMERPLEALRELRDGKQRALKGAEEQG